MTKAAHIRRNASALIVIHNHPSGGPTPSPDNVTITRAIVQVGKLLDSKIKQMQTPDVTFHARIRLDTLRKDDLARGLFANMGMKVEA